MKRTKKRGLQTLIAEEDADVEIVKVAIEKLNTFKKVVVVGSDTDLAVLLIALAPEKQSIYFCKHRGGESPTTVFYQIETLIEKHKHNRKLLLFIHALTGCDTTSCFFRLGKVKAVEMIKLPEAERQARIFLEDAASKEELLANGEKFVLGLYGLSKYSNLNEARYYRFTTLTKKLCFKIKF